MPDCYICKKKQQKFNAIMKHTECKGKLSDKEFKFRNYDYNYPKLQLTVNPSYFKKLYLEEEYSLPEFNREFGIHSGITMFLLQYLNIPQRSMKDVVNSKKYKTKIETTNIARYGASNPLSKNTIPYHKRNATIKSKYGVDNVFQLEKIKQQINETCLLRYGVLRIVNPQKISETRKSFSQEKRNEIKKKYQHTVSLRSPEEIARLANITSVNTKKWWKQLSDEEYNRIYFPPSRMNKLESRISNILTEKLNLPFSYSKFVNRRQYDFLIYDKILIEVQGDFWHGNPKIYDATDIVCHPKKHVLAKELWLNDLLKKENAEKYGYRIIYLWESDLAVLSNEEVSFLILQLIKELT